MIMKSTTIALFALILMVLIMLAFPRATIWQIALFTSVSCAPMVFAGMALKKISRGDEQ